MISLINVSPKNVVQESYWILRLKEEVAYSLGEMLFYEVYCYSEQTETCKTEWTTV